MSGQSVVSARPALRVVLGVFGTNWLSAVRNFSVAAQDQFFPFAFVLLSSSFCLLISSLLRAFPQRLVVIARGRILFFDM